MNTSKLIWGGICLVLAAAVAALNIILPPDSLMFTVGGANLPWVPVIALAVIGLALLVSGVTDHTVEPLQPTESDAGRAALNKRLENVAWGVFLIMLGGFLLVPHTIVAQGVWSIAVGLVMLGLNAARYFNGIRMSGFTTVLGLLSVVSGVASLAGWSEFDGAMLLIIIGTYLIARPWFDRHALFGKAEHSRA